MPPKNVIERAFELAQSGRYPSVEAIRRKLQAEQYQDYRLEGRALRDQLWALIREARGEPPLVRKPPGRKKAPKAPDPVE